MLCLLDWLFPFVCRFIEVDPHRDPQSGPFPQDVAFSGGDHLRSAKVWGLHSHQLDALPPEQAGPEADPPPTIQPCLLLGQSGPKTVQRQGRELQRKRRNISCNPEATYSGAETHSSCVWFFTGCHADSCSEKERGEIAFVAGETYFSV